MGLPAVSAWFAGFLWVAKWPAAGLSSPRAPAATAQRTQLQCFVLKGVLHTAEDPTKLGPGPGTACAQRPQAHGQRLLGLLWQVCGHGGSR